MSSYSPSSSLRGPGTSSLAASARRPHSTHRNLELLEVLTRHIARGRPLDAVALIDRLLAAGLARRDPAAATDLRVLRNVAELELARQLGSPQQGGAHPAGGSASGAITTILEFADRILPALEHTEIVSKPSVLTEPVQDGWSWREPAEVLQPPARLLSEREFDVLHLVAIGLSNLKIAHALFISEGTVKKHLSNVLAKLGAENRTEAVAIARRRGMLEE